MAIDRGIINRYPTVPGNDLPVFRNHEGVNLGDPAIEILERIEQTDDCLSYSRKKLCRNLQRDGQIEGIVRTEPRRTSTFIVAILSEGTDSISIPPSVVNMITGPRTSLAGLMIDTDIVFLVDRQFFLDQDLFHL